MLFNEIFSYITQTTVMDFNAISKKHIFYTEITMKYHKTNFLMRFF